MGKWGLKANIRCRSRDDAVVLLDYLKSVGKTWVTGADVYDKHSGSRWDAYLPDKWFLVDCWEDGPGIQHTKDYYEGEGPYEFIGTVDDYINLVSEPEIKIENIDEFL